MPDEIAPYFEMKYADSEGTRLSFKAGSDVTFTITTKRFNWVKHNVAHDFAENMYLGDVETLGWCICINRDETNFVAIGPPFLTSLFAAIFVRPLGGVLFHFGSGFTVSGASDPKIQADTAACQVEYCILST